MHIITGYVRWTDGKAPVSRVEIDTGDAQGVVSLKIPYGQAIGYGIENSEYREANHRFRIDGNKLLGVDYDGD